MLSVRLKSFLSSFMPFILVALFVCNFVVSCCVYRSTRPQFVFSHSEVTNFVYSVVTNTVELSSSNNSGSFEETTSSKTDDIRSRSFEHRAPYQSFVLNGRKAFRYFGHDYFSGDVCSLGVVLSIYPDKVYFHNGNVLVNLPLDSHDNQKARERFSK